MNEASRITQRQVDALGRFFAEFRAGSSLLAIAPSTSSLGRFFAEFKQLRPSLVTEQRRGQPPANIPNLERLEIFCDDIGPLAKESARLGDFINVWEIAGLKRAELRNAAVLAWLFDGHQTHGHGAEILSAFLRRVANRYHGKFSPTTSILDSYVVRKEAYLDENMENRLDIVIDGNCLLIIEVKIDAAPEELQIQDYLSLAESKAYGRPYCVILLAPEQPSGFSVNSPFFFIATWKDVSGAIEEISRSAQLASIGFGDRVLRQFARHVDQF
jgi:hypothetical protein